MAPYSIQQIKFECLSYIKEFGARMDEWVMGAAADPERALAHAGVDLEHGVWIWKPALSPAAARLVLDFFTRRYQVAAAEAGDHAQAGPANCIYMYRKPAGEHFA